MKLLKLLEKVLKERVDIARVDFLEPKTLSACAKNLRSKLKTLTLKAFAIAIYITNINKERNYERNYLN